MNKLVVATLIAVSSLTSCSSSMEKGDNAQQTAAPPELQATIQRLFPRSAVCGPPKHYTVLSSERTADAAYEGNTLVKGEIHELWEGKDCETGTKVRVLFRLGPDKEKQLSIVGFERTQ